MAFPRAPRLPFGRRGAQDEHGSDAALGAGSGGAAADREIGDALVALTGPDQGGSRRDRARGVGRLAAALARSGRAAGGRAVVGGRWLVDVLLDVAPRIPVRDLATLREQHDGLQGDLLAEALITGASRATAAVGAAGGAVAAVEWAAPPTLLVSGPAQIAAETLAVAAIEVKLIAELHQVYGVTPHGSTGQRAASYVWSWTNRRGIDPLEPTAVGKLITGPARRSIRNRLAGRAARNLGTLGPMLTGAAIGSVTNARETTHVGRAVMDDLRGRRA